MTVGGGWWSLHVVVEVVGVVVGGVAVLEDAWWWAPAYFRIPCGGRAPSCPEVNGSGRCREWGWWGVFLCPVGACGVRVGCALTGPGREVYLELSCFFLLLLVSKYNGN